jgi:hypothetical protein
MRRAEKDEEQDEAAGNEHGKAAWQSKTCRESPKNNVGCEILLYRDKVAR